MSNDEERARIESIVREMFDMSIAEHAQDHADFRTDVLPFIRLRMKQIQRREDMYRRIKEQVFLWGVLATILWVGRVVWKAFLGGPS